MRRVRQALLLAATLALFAAPSLAGSKAQPEYNLIKSLAGTWEGKTSGGKPVKVSYKLVSGGTAVMENIEEGSGTEMISLYYLDGDHVMMTHYCPSNNQPRLRADKSVNPGVIKFTFVDATNLSSPDAGHMHAHSIIWKDSNHVTQHWTWREKGHEQDEVFELQRQK